MNEDPVALVTERTSPVKILLVEDNPGDVTFIKVGLERIRTSTQVQVASDGEAALKILARAKAGYLEERPDLLLLDLNLPGMRGMEVLQSIRGDPVLADLRVVILTSSNDPRDHQAAKELNADDYLVKPASLEELFALIEGLERKWLTK